MNREKEFLDKARQQINAQDYTAAEQTLLQAATDLPPNLEIYNSLMELYCRTGIFPKVAEYFKTTVEKFPDLDLESCFMISDNLLKAGAITECELVLMLTQQLHPQNQASVADRLLKLYMHPDVNPHLVYNFVKANFSVLSIPTEMSRNILRKLSVPELSKERYDFFFYIFNTSIGDIHRKKLLLKEFLSTLKKPEEVMEILHRLNSIGLSLEPAIYFTISSYLLQIDAPVQAKKVLEQGIEKEPESDFLFKEALELMHTSEESTHKIKKLDEMSTK